LALLIYATYSNLLSIVQASIAQSRIDLATGLWGVHALMAVVLVLLFYRRVMVFSLFRLVK
jgi:lipopolysaccharide export system permease protein